MKLTSALSLTGLFIVSVLTGCGGGGSGSSAQSGNTGSNNFQPASEMIQISGGGIKGPLAFADTKVFVFDPSFQGFYDKNSPIATAMTDQYAQIAGLAVPRKIKPPYILTIGGDQAIDLNTGKPPVIPRLITVITKDMLSGNRPIYATPLTTLAFNMAQVSSNPQTGPDSFVQRLIDAAAEISTTFAIDTSHPIDILSSPLLIDRNTNTLAEQEMAVYHRAAVEAFAAKVYLLSSVTKGNGLHATYYNDLNLTQAVLNRVDSGVNFDWGTGSPDAAVNTNGFSVRWSGLVLPEFSDLYTFYTSTDDGVRLWVNGQLLIDQWVGQPETEYSATIQLNADQKYPIVMEYYEAAGDAVAKLFWSATNQSKTTIPKASLYSVSDPSVLDSLTTDGIIERLALDLQSDQVVNGSENGTAIGGIDPQIMNMEPGKLSIPNTPYLIENTVALMSDERVILGIENDTVFHVDSITLTSEPTTTATTTKELDVESDPAVAPEPATAFSVNQLGFGTLDVGAISNPVSVALKNTGSGPFTVSGISISTNFLQTNNCNGYLPAGSSCSFSVQFVPTTGGSSTGALTVTGNDTAGVHIVSLTGSGHSGAPATTLTSSGPVVINGEQGTVISGLRISNPNGSCIEIKNGATNIVIENNEIGPCGNKGVDIVGSSGVVVRGNHIHDIWHEAVMSIQSDHIAVDANVIETVEAGYEMWGTSKGNLSFTNNYVKNVSRRDGSRNGGNIAMAAFVHGGGIRITNNIGINVLGESNPEDLVNIYKSNGTTTDPIQIRNNRFYGGGPSSSGGGIILGDQGGSYQLAEGNILVSPGNYGIAIAGGHHNTLRNNKVYSPADSLRSFANVGAYVLRFDSHGDGTKPGDCHSHTVSGNEITFWKGANWKGLGGSAALNPAYNPGTGVDGLAPNCGSVAGWDTNKFDSAGSRPANLDMSVWDPAWNTP